MPGRIFAGKSGCAPGGTAHKSGSRLDADCLPAAPMSADAEHASTSSNAVKARDVIAPLYAKAAAAARGSSCRLGLFAPEERRERAEAAVGGERNQHDARALVHRRVVVCARRA